MRAISASSLHQRTSHIYVASDELRESGVTYVLPKNLLRRFITCGDLRTQVGAFLYGVTPPDNASVREIRALVLPPQLGTHQGVQLPSAPPEHDALRGLQALGWMHTQPNETPSLSPIDCTLHARACAERAPPGTPAAWDPDTSICVTASFTPGSVSLAAYRLTPAGHEWGRANKDPSPQPAGYAASHADKVQLLLSDRFLGVILQPADGVWNYNFQGVKFVAAAKYPLALGPPAEFYAERHRPAHFLTFGGGAGGAQGGDAAAAGGDAVAAVDRENLLE